MAEEESPAGTGAETDGQAEAKQASAKKKATPAKKASTKKKAAPAKKSTSKKKAAPKKKRVTKKKPVPKKQADKQLQSANIPKSKAGQDKDIVQVGELTAPKTKTEDKQAEQTDAQLPPSSEPTNITRKKTYWPWISLIVIIGIAVYLLQSQLRKPNHSVPSVATLEDGKISTAFLDNRQEHGSDSSSHAQVQSDDTQDKTNMSQQQTGDEITKRETGSDQAPTTTETVIQANPAETPGMIADESTNLLEENNAQSSLSTSEDLQADVIRSDQDQQLSTIEPQSPPSPAQNTLAGGNTSTPSIKTETAPNALDGQANISSAEDNLTQQATQPRTQEQNTTTETTISDSATTQKKITGKENQIGPSQRELDTKGRLGMPFPKNLYDDPSAAWRHYWQRRQRYPSPQNVPNHGYNRYYSQRGLNPYHYYGYRIPFPNYYPYRFRQPDFPNNKQD